MINLFSLDYPCTSLPLSFARDYQETYLYPHTFPIGDTFMQWQQVCDDPLLQNLPYKIELNQWGQVVMSPARVKHGFFQNRIGSLLESLLATGEVITECAIQTTDNVKVADVAWASDERADIIFDEVSASIAPEICIEIISESNTNQEMQFKQNLYFDAGAQEVWVCDRQGNISFYKPGKPLDCSELVPDFPKQIKRRKQHNEEEVDTPAVNC